jgi:hypothetical protein
MVATLNHSTPPGLTVGLSENQVATSKATE